MADIGIEAARAIRAALQVDDEWSLDLPRGFMWWGDQIRQDVFASESWIEGEEYARIVVRTHVLGRPNPGPPTEAELASMNAVTTGGAFSLGGEDKVVHEASVLVSEESVPWVVRATTTLATVALTSGVRVAQEHASRLGTALLDAHHPRSGRRREPDDMLNLPRQLAIPAGRDPFDWGGAAAFVEAAQTLASVPGCDVTSAGRALLEADLAFSDGSLRSRLAVGPTRRSGDSSGEPPLDAADPEYGHGLIAWLVLPYATDFARAASLASMLNRKEMTAPLSTTAAGSMHFGAWTVRTTDGASTPAYRMFLPNVLGMTVYPQNVVVHMWARNLNAGHALLTAESATPASRPSKRSPKARRAASTPSPTAPTLANRLDADDVETLALFVAVASLTKFPEEVLSEMRRVADGSPPDPTNPRGFIAAALLTAHASAPATIRALIERRLQAPTTVSGGRQVLDAVMARLTDRASGFGDGSAMTLGISGGALLRAALRLTATPARVVAASFAARSVLARAPDARIPLGALAVGLVDAIPSDEIPIDTHDPTSIDDRVARVAPLLERAGIEPATAVGEWLRWIELDRSAVR